MLEMSARLLALYCCAICWRPLDLEVAFRPVPVCVCLFLAVKIVDKFCWPVGGTQIAFVVVVEICVIYYEMSGCPSLS